MNSQAQLYVARPRREINRSDPFGLRRAKDYWDVKMCARKRRFVKNIVERVFFLFLLCVSPRVSIWPLTWPEGLLKFGLKYAHFEIGLPTERVFGHKRKK